MKSGLRRLRNVAAPSGPPVPLSTNFRRGRNFDLGAGKLSHETLMRTYGQSGTVFAIVSLLQQAAASSRWHLYKKQPVDGRRRYASSDQGSDQRQEVTVHPALSLWNKPNGFMSGFEFREGSNQHEELVGETIWVVAREVVNFPTAMWYVNPGRMEPVPDPANYIVGWIYTGPAGDQVPLKLDEVIQEKLPNPLDPFRGAGPVASILSNIQQQKYATDYQRNLFINGADPGGVITFPADKSRMDDREFDEFTDRWREQHQGIARAGAVAVLEAGAAWTPSGQTNRDLEYGNLRLANRDEIREAWRMHKAMLGTVEDVNRANAQTGEEIFTGWMTTPRLERRRDTLNHKLLPMFGDATVEFDFEDPTPTNPDAANAELTAKATAAQTLVAAGFDPSDVLEVVGLPDMDVVEKAAQIPAAPPGWVPAPPAAPAAPAPPEGPVTGVAGKYLAGRPKALTAPAAWPGWGRDVTLTALYAGEIASAAVAAVSAADIAEQWEASQSAPPAGQQDEPPTAAELAAATAFLGSTAVSASLTTAIAGVLASLWAEGWFLGEASAESAVTGAKPDWRDWTPGDADAARKAASRELPGFIGDQNGTAAGVADSYVTRLARVLAGARKQNQLRKAMTATLKNTLSDQQQAAVTAHTELSKSQFGAAGLVFRKNHVTAVDIVTTGDDKVCPACEALMDGNPHPIPSDGLAALLPAHPGDRCVALPAARDADMAALFTRVLNDGHMPVELGRRQ